MTKSVNLNERFAHHLRPDPPRRPIGRGRRTACVVGMRLPEVASFAGSGEIRHVRPPRQIRSSGWVGPGADSISKGESDMDARHASCRPWGRRLALLVGTLVGTSLASFAGAAEPYALVDLGVDVSPEDVNGLGVVVGSRRLASGATAAFVYTSADGMLQDIDGTIAHAVNDAGLIAGDTLIGAFLLQDGVFREFADTSALGISENGLVSGYRALDNPYRPSPQPLAPALYDGTAWQVLDVAKVYSRGTRQGVYADLFVLTDVNEAGYAVGSKSRYGLYGSSAILTPPAFDQVVYLPIPNGGRAAAINGANLVVGETGEDSATGTFAHAFLYDGARVTDLGTLAGGLRSSASDINEADQVVGDSWLETVNTSLYQPDRYHAFLWESGPGMRDLNDLVSAPGWILTSATAINDSGDIVGTGIVGGELHGYLLVAGGSPPPPPVSSGEPPVAVASSDVTKGKAPLAVRFDATGSRNPDGLPLAYAWDFGDGASSQEPSPSHIYQTPGVFVATLTVHDEQAQSASAQVEITVRGTQKSGR
jgi:probable HAF family extracellular repeat protein